MLTIDTSTKKKREDLKRLFESFHSKAEIFEYFNVCRNTTNNNIITSVANKIGFDFSYYKTARHRYCLRCGKRLEKKQKKFCSSSCAAAYNNKGRIMSDETKEKIRTGVIKSYRKRIFLTDEQIAEIIEILKSEDINKISYADLSRKFGISLNLLKKIADEQGVARRKISNIKTKSKTGTNWYCLNCGKYIGKTKKLYCSRECQTTAERNKKIDLWKKEPSRYYVEKVPEFIRDYIYGKYEYCCSSCGNNDVNPFSGRTIMQLHHIDGNCKNNSEDNLTILCPNCHAMTNNFGALNIGNGTRNVFREYHRIHKETDSSTNL